MIRPFRSEVERYGDYSKAGEFVYDHPFLWGSKRTGPDLHRLGGKYPDSWHFLHMKDPQSTSPGSIRVRKSRSTFHAVTGQRRRAISAVLLSHSSWLTRRSAFVFASGLVCG